MLIIADCVDSENEFLVIDDVAKWCSFGFDFINVPRFIEESRMTSEGMKWMEYVYYGILARSELLNSAGFSFACAVTGNRVTRDVRFQFSAAVVVADEKHFGSPHVGLN